MIPAAFAYRRAASLTAALDLLASGPGRITVLAGGQSLLPALKSRTTHADLLLDIGQLAELSYIRDTGDHLAIGAATRHHRLATDPLVIARAPVLAAAAAEVADPQVRHLGTIGGSLAHADPAADLPMALVALGGSVELTGPGGTRTVGAEDFFAGYFETALEPDELLTAVRVPGRPGQPWGYQKFVRRANDWAIVGVAAVGGRIALANMGPVPLRATAAEQALAGGASVAEAAELAAEGTSPGEDIHADREYRRHLARVLTRRALSHEA